MNNQKPNLLILNTICIVILIVLATIGTLKLASNVVQEDMDAQQHIQEHKEFTTFRKFTTTVGELGFVLDSIQDISTLTIDSSISFTYNNDSVQFLMHIDSTTIHLKGIKTTGDFIIFQKFINGF